MIIGHNVLTYDEVAELYSAVT